MGRYVQIFSEIIGVSWQERVIAEKFGVVLFDDVKEPMDGFSCVAGKTPSRISGINELSTDVIWWTNIPYQEFYNSTEAWRSPWLRHDKYLVVSPRDALISGQLTLPRQISILLLTLLHRRLMGL